MRERPSTIMAIYWLCCTIAVVSGCSSTPTSSTSEPLSEAAPVKGDTTFPEPRGIGEFLGFWTGALVSPLFGLGSMLRQDRFFHPRGIYFTARVEPAPGVRNYEDLARRLSGEALVRLSAGLWRTEHNYLPDVLGFTIRFQATPALKVPGPDVQDLLMVTARSPWTLIIDSFRTDQSSFLANPYTGLSPFVIDGEPGFEIRVLPHPEETSGDTRYDRIRHLVEKNRARFLLEVAAEDAPDEWHPVVVILLEEEEVEVNESELLFWPFRDGLGIEPQGFVHYLRAVPYVVSRFGRNVFSD